MLKIIKAMSGAVGFSNVPLHQRHIIFYSEGKNYWPHLESLLNATLENTTLSVCYVSSSLDDPGLNVQHPRLKTFFIGMGFIRDYVFQNLNTKTMVMTMPDLHQYQVKRSKNKVHYIYVQHSMVSLHMIYRHGAFDHYDTICCAGPHHVQEVRAIEKKYNLPKKNILKLGYSRLDSLLEQAQKHSQQKHEKQNKTILIAPSWGPEGLIESGLAKSLVDQLLELGHTVILRPHPQTIKFNAEKVKQITQQHTSKPHFTFENHVAGQDSLHKSDIMISDWSGAAFEYAFALNKPVIFCDVPKKINNPHYKDISLEPIEISLRHQMGVIWDGKTPIKESLAKIETMPTDQLQKLCSTYVFNPGNTADIFTDYLGTIK